ncbi:flippase [Pedobacter chinensis]|uniref:Flippase n=1 Tax=Pedobacter chinensis TaxID=2282421 RepID=A0A369PSJ8_9SPHI|nr:flippase [Pedobacter chinensis]RDC54255.1 flippase [Pedobacter chinensis]
MGVLRKNAAYNIVLALTQVLFPIITFPYASRVLGPEALGAVSFADNFTIYFLILSGLGIPLYGVREVARAKHDSKLLGKTFSELFSIHAMSAIIATGILFLISWYIDKLHSNFALYQIGMAILMGSIFISEWFFQGMEEFRYITLRTVLIRLLTISLMFLFVRGPEDKNIYYGLNLLIALISGGFNMYFITKRIKISFTNLAIKKHLKPLFLILASAMVTTIYLVFDTVILGFLTNDITVGYYAASMRIAKISLSVMGAVSLALLPRLTQAFYQQDYSTANGLLNKSIRFVIFLGIPIAMGIFCLANEVVNVFAGSDYLPAANSLRILSCIVIFVGLAQVFSNQILLPLKQERKIFYASIAGVIVSLILNFMLIPIFRHNGAAISSLLTELVVVIILYIFTRTLFVVSMPVSLLLKSLFTSSFFFLIRYLVSQFTALPILVLTFTIGICVTFYILVQLFIWKNKDMIEVLSVYRPLGFLSRLIE